MTPEAVFEARVLDLQAKAFMPYRQALELASSETSGVLCWIIEYGAIGLPLGHPSRLTCFYASHSLDEVIKTAEECDFNHRIFPVFDRLASMISAGGLVEASTVDNSRCKFAAGGACCVSHCGDPDCAAMASSTPSRTGEDAMSKCLPYIRKTYRLDVKRGDRVRYTGGNGEKFGTVTGASDAYLNIRMDGEKHAGRYHPTWELTLLPRTPSTPPQEAK